MIHLKLFRNSTSHSRMNTNGAAQPYGIRSGSPNRSPGGRHLSLKCSRGRCQDSDLSTLNKPNIYIIFYYIYFYSFIIHLHNDFEIYVLFTYSD
jgi:hypothetical protein